MQAAGDGAAATRLVDYLSAVFQKADGSWWQPEGRRREVLDEPAARRGRAAGRARLVARAARRRGLAPRARRGGLLLALKGPKTQQERWENQEGWSPNTIATEIAALICAADIARANGDPARAASYEAKADDSGEGRVVDRDEHRSLHAEAVLPADHQGRQPERRHDLRARRQPARQGRPAHDRRQQLLPRARAVRRQALGRRRAQLARGRRRAARHDAARRADLRFSRDGYGETEQGGDWDIFEQAAQTLRAWPLLSGERGEYELAPARTWRRSRAARTTG